jgi:hypothetical protein
LQPGPFANDPGCLQDIDRGEIELRLVDLDELGRYDRHPLDVAAGIGARCGCRSSATLLCTIVRHRLDGIAIWRIANAVGDAGSKRDL